MPFRLRMGSRVSTNNNSNGEMKPPNSIKSRGKNAVVDLQRELLERDESITRKDTEINRLREELTKRNEEIAQLQKRIHELDCVVQQTSSSNEPKLGELPRILEEKPALVRTNSMKWKRQAVSGESSSNIQRQESNRELLKFSKDLR